MSLVTYEQARPWALAIKKATQSRAMPPWFAEPGITRYANEHEKVLSEKALDTLARWADGGDRPAPAARESRAAGTSPPTSWWRCRSRSRSGARHHPLQVRVREDRLQGRHVGGGRGNAPGNAQCCTHGKVGRPSKWMENAVPEGVQHRKPQRHILGRNASRRATTSSASSIRLGPQRFDRQGAAKFIPEADLSSCTTRRPARRRPMRRRSASSTAPARRLPSRAPSRPRRPRHSASRRRPASLTGHARRGAPRYASAAYAPARQGLRSFARRVVPEGDQDHGAQGKWILRVADGPDDELAAAGGDPAKGSKLQFITHFDNSPGQPVQPGPRQPRIEVVSASQELGRDGNCFIGVLFDRNTGRPRQVFAALGAEPAAAGGVRADARGVQPGVEGRRGASIERRRRAGGPGPRRRPRRSVARPWRARVPRLVAGMCSPRRPARCRSSPSRTRRARPGPTPRRRPSSVSYQPVTAARLLQPEDANWLMIRRTYDGWGYSPLDQITTANVAQLKPVWSIPTGEGRVHEAAPIVNNGVMFVSTPNNQVMALDAKTGDVLWRYRRPRPKGVVRAARHEPRRRALRRQGLLRRRRSRARGARREDRQGSVDDDRRRQQVRVLHHAGAARRRRQGDGRRVGRRVRRSRLRRGVRSRDRQGAVAHLHGSGARRARQRDLAEGRSVEDRRRAGLGHRQLRSGDEPRVLGHRQRRAVDGRPASRRQPLRRVDGRRSTSRPGRSRGTSSTTRTSRGTGTKCRRRSSSTTSATAARSRG